MAPNPTPYSTLQHSCKGTGGQSSFFGASNTGGITCQPVRGQNRIAALSTSLWRREPVVGPVVSKTTLHHTVLMCAASKSLHQYSPNSHLQLTACYCLFSNAAADVQMRLAWQKVLLPIPIRLDIFVIQFFLSMNWSKAATAHSTPFLLATAGRLPRHFHHSLTPALLISVEWTKESDAAVYSSSHGYGFATLVLQRVLFPSSVYGVQRGCHWLH